MEVKLKQVSVFRDLETGRRKLNLKADKVCFKRIAKDTWQVTDSDELTISLASFAHFLNEQTDDLSIDISFMLMDIDEEQIRFALQGATVEVAQELVEAGTVIKNDDGTKFTAEHDFFRVNALHFKSVTHVGRVALDYNGTDQFNGRSAEVKAAYRLDRKEAAK